MAEQSPIHCSFCHTSSKEVKKLIAGPECYICDRCINHCYDALNNAGVGIGDNEADDIGTADNAVGLPKPRELKEFLDQYVIGQEHAKEVLSVAVYNHYKRLENPVIDGVEIEKSNILLCGPTGVGKTLLAQTIARKLDVPFTTADATSLTEAGYVGEDVESIVGRLLAAADGDVSRAEHGIIFLDEIDKKRSKEGGNGGRDVSGEGVQQALLKLLEGAEVMVSSNGGRRQPSSELIKINTKNILFIVGGAFVGLEAIIHKSSNKKTSTIGFGSDTSKKIPDTVELLKKVESEHLVSFGIIPELIGRLPIITALHDLDESQLVRVLTEPKNAIVKQFAALFKIDGVELEFDDEALLAVAKLARKRKTNGRALRGVLESRLLKTQFRLPDLKESGAKKIIIRADSIDGNVDPEVIYN